MGVGQVSEAMGHAAPHVAEASKLDIEPARIPQERMAEIIVMDPLHRLQAAIRVLAPVFNGIKRCGLGPHQQTQCILYADYKCADLAQV